jgi:hypothetical protein
MSHDWTVRECKPVSVGDTEYFFSCRLGILDTSLFAGVVVGTYLGAPLFSVAGRYGYLTVFGTSAMCFLVSFLYVTFIPESVDVNQVSELNNFYPLG